VRIGVDIGGTFTDLVSLGRDGAILTRKVPSTTDDYARGIATALTDLFVANHLRAAAIDEIIHAYVDLRYVGQGFELLEHGVVVDPYTLSVDRDATTALRIRLAGGGEA
jgi:hypothetical protein